MNRSFPYAGGLIITFLAGGVVNSVKAESEEVKQGSGEQIKIASDIPFSQATQVRDAVRNECNLGGKLSGFILEYGTRYDLNIVQSTDTASDQGKVLRIEINGVQGAGGGAWSCAKRCA